MPQNIDYRSHRIAYFLSYKKDPGDLCVCHTCDNPACCNPAHLWLGTLKQNTLDSVQKGRHVNPSLKGSKCGAARLTETQVRRIRKQYAKGGISHQALGNEYGVNRATISYLLAQKTWKHI